MPYESNTWKMYVIGFLAHLQFFVAVSVPFFMDWGGLNFTKILFLQSWFMFWSFVMEIPTGAIADYFGRKTSILLACFINGIAALIYGSIPNFYVFMLGEFVWGMSIALISGADNALIYDSLKKTNKTKTAKKIFARYTYMTSLGIVVAGPIGSFIAGFLGLRSSMLLTSIPLFLAGLISLTLKEPKVRNRTKERTKYLDLIKEGIKFIKNNKILRILSLDFSLMFLLFYFILWLWQPMLQKSRLNIVYWGFVSSAFNVFSIIIAENIERIEKLFGKKIFLFSSFLVAGVLYFFGGLTNYLPFILIIIFLIFALRLTRFSLTQHYINKHVPSNVRATILSTISMVGKFFVVVANPIVGYLMDWSLNYTLMILGFFGILFSIISWSVIKDNMLKV